ncbi:Hypothetical_protein [Hexamita inflata]|uniref:Hypothetical_protein n=1 Tax=Hexamita inflata TaxID=28002 RepID=A0AA86QC83_9EUKA|nr:Hypothetical protein HINF_LOCUS43730 [Hexamita inflata]
MEVKRKFEWSQWYVALVIIIIIIVVIYDLLETGSKLQQIVKTQLLVNFWIEFLLTKIQIMDRVTGVRQLWQLMVSKSNSSLIQIVIIIVHKTNFKSFFKVSIYMYLIQTDNLILSVIFSSQLCIGPYSVKFSQFKLSQYYQTLDELFKTQK